MNPETPPPMHWQKVALIGVGLLGGSLGLALKKRGLATRVEGYVRREASVAGCEQAGAVDRASTDLASVVTGADLVVFCTPLGQMKELAERLAPHLRKGALVTDVGSVKGSVCRDLTPIIAAAGGEFVGSHPMAGGEKMGVGAARAELFENTVCVVTPASDAQAASAKQLAEFWKAMGSCILMLSPENHDELVARSSHLPHLVASALATSVLAPELPSAIQKLCATGFRDTTRVASGSPEMWRDIALANRAQLSRVLGEVTADLERLRSLLDAGDAIALEKFFTVAKQRRDAWGNQRS
ncbi:MAG TPA: prephenate dehydrogenase, partial [Verrucomicrobiae bacterium]|nr:prephenate dehydrogenase [Verrucomicrobiae bacterium]